MTSITGKALNAMIEVERIIDRIDGKSPGPCLVFFAGIHGNEPSGIFALKKVFEEFKEKAIPIRGTLIAISGNLWALERGVRFQKKDLNRLWLEKNITALERGKFIPQNEDEKQQEDIYIILTEILDQEKGPFYFFDLHTTSGESAPFITVNDSILNRKFTMQYPLPLILGIEEHLSGPLLSYINDLGYVSFGFEAGQHDSLTSITNHKIFIYLSCYFSGAIDGKELPVDEYLNRWKKINPEHRCFYEIYARYEIQANEKFSMESGFSNFDKVNKGQKLACSDGKQIVAPKNTTLFMPLYQTQGTDGYFLIKRTPRFFLWLSGVVRKFKMDRIFPLLPGVRWKSKEKDVMIVNQTIARFVAKQLFHLFGYRSKQLDQTHLIIRNREYKSKINSYKNESWYKSNF